ncbi:DedA family protein [Bifidobacterium vansinderenii]|uniref:SNARE associated Golgi protein n=1 Tax=Bifidobacterium vansinderenii TaxID=1984871 RepID=A0A229VZE3_9BIFI|nr:VTT domain-containing protein [Bifidobacterium vansinderenii]OXN00936.1 SNARE associated Golgi protein [Bifidobacterium vansinderenii]
MPSFLSPEFIISAAGPWALIISALIVFAETGLLVGFFLPGDSLVFLLGMVSAATALPDSPLAHTPLALICVVIGIAAFVGDQTGYELGRKGRDSRLLQSWTQGKNAERLERAHAFFVKYGYKAIILARFVPILRTFTPFAVGLTHYDHRKFISANLIGTLIWGLALPTLGHQLGRVSLIANNIDAVCIIIVLISVMPLVIKGIRSALASRGATQA